MSISISKLEAPLWGGVKWSRRLRFDRKGDHVAVESENGLTFLLRSREQIAVKLSRDSIE